MQLYLSGHKYHYECENLCRLFFPYSPVKRVESIEANAGEPCASAVIEPEAEGYSYFVSYSQDEKRLERTEKHNEESEYILTSMLFELFREATGYSPKWGMLTGIHPVKLLGRYEQESGAAEAERVFKEDFFVSAEKYALSKRTLDVQRPYTEAVKENDFSLYIGIPFCPSRCSYCSFVSQSTDKSQKLIGPYFELLLKEIEKTAEVTAELGLNLTDVYIGGGTPTTLSAEQLSRLTSFVRASFDMTAATEFTVEAGRPDTIDEAKLLALKSGGVSRISINPQSLSDKVLRAIGRNHSAEAIYEAFDLAKKAGFSSINSDLIAGLPEDDMASFRNTIGGVLSLGATNITVHSLALKRSATLVEQRADISSHRDAELVNEMMDYSIKKLTEEGFEPYYLYRQTRMAGNLENTGWAKNGDICAYNIRTMDESSTVIACGAGGVTKVKDPYSTRLERIFNFKYPYEYIERNDQIIERKEGVKELYEQFRKRIH